jgi:5-hydroxyisourate hydrolase-like protein (transthyretin family)
MKLLLLLFAILQSVPVPQQGQSANPGIRGSIQGIVKAPNAAEGVPDAQITLTPVGPGPGVPQNSVTKTSDAGGRFSFTDLPEGRYTVRAQREGYFPPTVNGVTPPPQSGAIATATITKDAPNPQVTVPLVPGGIISGYIRDTQGKPASGVPVTVLRAAYQDGRRTLTAVSTSANINPLGAEHSTNDRGEYRIFWVPPGEYFVRTDVANNIVAFQQPKSSTVPLLTYYPGTTDASRAVPVTVMPGQEVPAIDFPIESAPAFSISGKVSVLVSGGLALPTGQSFRSVSSFFVVPQNASPGDRFPLTTNSKLIAGGNSASQTDFEFELHGIAPGSYYVYPLFLSGQPGNANPGGGYYATRMAVDVFDKDVTGITGVIQRNPDLKFHVSLQGNPPPNPRQQQNQTAIRVQLRSQEALPPLVSGALSTMQQAQPDGSITFPNLFPSKYKIAIPQVPGGYYIADIRQGSATLYNDGILTVTGEEPAVVELTLKAGGASVQGVVRDKEGKPVTGSVVLIPSPPRRQNSLLYKRVTANPDTGQFTLNGVAPGEYRLFAWQKAPAGAEENEEFLAKYQNRGQSVTVTGDGAITSLSLDLLVDAQ